MGIEVLRWETLGLTYDAQGMKCLFYFCITTMTEDTSAHLSGRRELHGGAGVITLVALRNVLKGSKRVIKKIKC